MDAPVKAWNEAFGAVVGPFRWGRTGARRNSGSALVVQEFAQRHSDDLRLQVEKRTESSNQRVEFQEAFLTMACQMDTDNKLVVSKDVVSRLQAANLPEFKLPANFVECLNRAYPVIMENPTNWQSIQLWNTSPGKPELHGKGLL